jgi:O-succinylbenzoate synthase
MDVHAAELIRIRMPLRGGPFTTARSALADKEALLLRVDTDMGPGWGECVAQVEPTYAAETIDGARLVLRDHLLPRAFAGVGDDDVRGNPMARAALRLALLDARLRADDLSFARHLGASRAEVPAGVVVGLHGDVGRYVADGYRRIKCKIAPGHDVEVLHAARAVAGDDIELAADANGAYTLDDLETLRALDEFSLQCIEQPLPVGALHDHAVLASKITTPICLDESITDVASAQLALGSGACAAVSVKWGPLGRVEEAALVAQACAAMGAGVLAGGMLETGIGRAALVAVAALNECTLAGDCSASARYFYEDVTEPFELTERGTIAVPTAPVAVREDVIDRYAIARERIRPA